MEDQERGLTVNIGEYKGEKPIIIEYREGRASQPVQPLETKAPEKLILLGLSLLLLTGLASVSVRLIRKPLMWLWIVRICLLPLL